MGKNCPYSRSIYLVSGPWWNPWTIIVCYCYPAACAYKTFWQGYMYLAIGVDYSSKSSFNFISSHCYTSWHNMLIL